MQEDGDDTMLLPYHGEWIGEIASIALVIILHVMQVKILNRIPDDRKARSRYAFLIAATVPVCWCISPYWNSRQNFSIATFLGWPVMVHAILLVSFFRGLALRQSGRLKWWRIESLLHLLIGMPIWFVLWSVIQLFCGFGYI
jgi:hypothetical protein